MKVKQIDYKDVKPYVMNIHYAHRMPNVMYSFGLFDGDKLMGVVTYGMPPSPSLCRGIAGDEYRSKVIELNRLVIHPECKDRNSASMLVGKSLRLLPKGLIVVSYADYGGQGHVGYVYQATNWKYTGMTKRRTDVYSETGHSRHHCGDLKQRQIRTEKHRYVTVTGNKKLLEKIRYKFFPYPKGDSQKYFIDESQKLLTLTE